MTGRSRFPSRGARAIPQGVAVAAVQYRHSRASHFPAQVHDVKAAVRWLRHHGPELGLGTSDQSEAIASAYRRVGATVELVRVPGAGHFFGDEDRDRLITLGLDFLLRHTRR